MQLETKARFIGQVITGDNAARRAEDIGGQELSYAEVKAIASGNPAVLTLAEADAELQRLNLLKKNHLDEQYVARRSVRQLPATIAEMSKRLTHLTADQATATQHADDLIVLDGHKTRREDVLGVLGGQLDSIPRNVRETARIPLGVYRGLRFGLVLHPHSSNEVFLDGAMMRRDTLSRDHQGPRAVLNALERVASSYGSECSLLRKELSISEAQLRDYQARLGLPFVHDPYLAELTGLRDRLKAGLAGVTEDSAGGEGASVPELVEKIKYVKACHTVEAMPQRGAKAISTAEEPVTARIRRKISSDSSTNSEVEADEPRIASARNKTAVTFQERLDADSRRDDEGPSLP